MPLTHHLLAKKFPEYKEKIHNLKASNNPFNRLLKRYETIEKNFIVSKVVNSQVVMAM